MNILALLFPALQVASPAPKVQPPVGDLPVAVINDNRTPAGTLRDGVLTLRLVATWSSWTLKSTTARNLPMLAFAEEGKAPTIPGPMIRVPVGTRVSVSIQNPFSDFSIVVRGLMSQSHPGRDSLVIEPGTTALRDFVADGEGTHFYWATISGATLPRRRFGYDSQLNGSFVVDGPSSSGRNDRIFVITLFSDSTVPNGLHRFDREFWSINGRSWPETERLEYTSGDSITWRVINASADVHPMHLHGFYFRVDARSALGRDTLYAPDQRRMAVTELMLPGTTMLMTWSPDRPGGWIFHCHMTVHLLPHGKLAGQPEPAHHEDPQSHTETGMNGLILAMNVKPRAGATAAAPTASRRHLRLIVRSDSTPTDSSRRFAFVLQTGDKEPPPDSLPVPGSRLVLRRGQPTTITVVNKSGEPASIHWHGIELDSYYDGVVGIGGMSGSVTPAILPADSFQVHITAPRSGSFMYHTHFDDVRQQRGGLYAPLTVIEPDAELDPERDLAFMVANGPSGVRLDGSSTPAPMTLRAGQTYRLRLANITVANPGLVFGIAQDSSRISWRAVAKDGFDLPAMQATERPARQVISNGEIYDFEFRPTRPGDMNFEVRAGGGNLLVSRILRVIP